MSNRPRLEILKEDYYTPVDVLMALLKTGVLKGVTSILEPCAGTGNIVRTLRHCGFDHHITAVEIASEPLEMLMAANPSVLAYGDYLKMELGTFDCVIINPPYSKIEAFIEKSHSHLNPSGRICALLRLAHLVGKARGKFLAKFKPSNVHLLCKRPSFSGTATDIGGYAWVVWDASIINQETQLNWI